MLMPETIAQSSYKKVHGAVGKIGEINIKCCKNLH